MYNSLRIFKYTRGDKYSCKIIVNEFAGSFVYSEVFVPGNTPAAVKEAFLEEAEKAVVNILTTEGTTVYRGE